MPNLENLISISSTGINFATYAEIRDALMSRYKEVYGSDIDLSTGSADGIFVNDLALVLNNIVRSMSIMYENLDVQTASGVYLDALCRLSNIIRKEATPSSAIITLTNNTGSTITDIGSVGNNEFIDKSNGVWIYKGALFDLANGSSKTITVYSEENGPIVANAGDIYAFVANGSLTVTQPAAAEKGTAQETDNELKARRSQSIGAAGTTVLGSLVGELLAVPGIEDVYIYDNNSGEDVELADGADVLAHSIYVALRYSNSIVPSDAQIGTIIYEKVTPGIQTTNTAAVGHAITSGTSKSYQYVPSYSGITLDFMDENVYWKQATDIHPAITFTLTPLDKFDVTLLTSNTDDNPIKKAIIDYANNVHVGEKLDANKILVEAIYADPTYYGRATYTVSNVTVATHINKIEYYYYDKLTATQSGNNWNITITKEQA